VIQAAGNVPGVIAPTPVQAACSGVSVTRQPRLIAHMRVPARVRTQNIHSRQAQQKLFDRLTTVSLVRPPLARAVPELRLSCSNSRAK
jgi:hypothetical protein